MRRTETLFSGILKLATVAALAFSASAGAQVNGEVEFDIDAQLLADALNQFALQSDREILFAPEAVSAQRTRGLHGNYAPEQALEMLLAGSGLTWRVTENRAILIDAAQAPESRPEATEPAEPPTEADDNPSGAAGTPRTIEEVVVVGTQIRGRSVAGILPVTVIGADDVAAIAPTSGDDLFRSIAQAGDVGYNEEGTTVGGVNSARGDVASINLRSIGTGNTLLLLNGRRMVLHPGVQVESLVPVTTVNTNALPVMGVERVEVLRDGAAAIYGTDAVAGVINVVLQDDIEGFSAEVRYGAADGDLDQLDLAAQAGKTFNDGRTNVSLFANYSDRGALSAADREYSRNTDRRPLVAGTPFEGDSDFDNRTSNGPWGYFDPLNLSDPITQDGAQISDGDGDVYVAPAGFATCTAPAGGVCLAPGSVPDELTYNQNHERDIMGSVERVNLFAFLNHQLDNGVELFGEAGYYFADYQSRREQGAALSSAPVSVPAHSYWNPFGPVTFADGRPNPNRLPGLDIPAEGLDLDLDLYRLIDVGPRVITVENTSYRALGGVRGAWRDWNWETALLYSEAETDDTTHNRVSSTLFQQALMLDTPEAYNPFNGGDPANWSAGDTTPSDPGTIDSFLIDVSRVSSTSLRLADVRVSRSDLFAVPAGEVGIGLGIENRRETYEDDRGPRLDGTITYTNPVTGDFSESDVLGSSATRDSAGSREVWSAYAELAVPLVNEDMNVPLVHSADLQIAGRIEDYDSFGTVAKPKVAASWYPAAWLQFRGSWSEGFRAPNLPQLFETGGERLNTRNDYIFCEADLRAGRIANFDECSRSQGVVSNRSGSRDLEPEETESFSVGAVFQPDFLPYQLGTFTVTLDFWRIEQEGVVGIFGDANQIALDYLRRVQGGANTDVIRADPTAEDVAAFAGTGLDPVGEIVAVDDGYMNLLPRKIEGVDLVTYYSLENTRWGDFDLTLNFAKLTKFDQAPSPEAQALIDAQSAGTISDVFAVIGVNSLIRMDALPEWRSTGTLNWRMGQWGAGLFCSYVGSVYDTSATLPDGALYKVDDWLTGNVYGQYTFDADDGWLSNARLRVGARNFTDEAPPLADSDYGYIGDLHSSQGRFLYASFRMNFGQ